MNVRSNDYVPLTESQLFIERGGRRVIEIFNWMGLAAAIFFLVAHLADVIPNSSGAIFAFVITTVSTVALARRHYLLCAWIIIGGMIGLGFYACLMWNGLRAQLLGLLPVAAMASFIVLPRRQAIGVVAIVPLGIIVIGFLGQNGYLPKPGYYQESSFAAVLFAYFLLGATLSYVAAKAFQDALTRSTILSRRYQKQLDDFRRHEASMANFFYATPLPSYISDLAGRILDINQAWTDTFGFDAADVIGRTTDVLRYWQDSEQPGRISAAMSGETPSTTQKVGLIVADGSPRTFLMTVARNTSVDGTRFLVQLVDHDEQAREEEAQRSALEQLQARVERMSHLAASNPQGE